MHKNRFIFLIILELKCPYIAQNNGNQKPSSSSVTARLIDFLNQLFNQLIRTDVIINQTIEYQKMKSHFLNWGPIVKPHYRLTFGT